MSESISVHLDFRGIDNLGKFLAQYPNKVLKKALRMAVSAGATPVARDARKMAPRLTGTLKKAIKKKVKTYPNGNAIALIGADRSVTSESQKTKTGLNIPANYIHLVDRGVKHHEQPNHWFFKRQGHPGIKGLFFIERAMQQNAGNVKAIMEEKMGEVLEREAAKFAKSS